MNKEIQKHISLLSFIMFLWMTAGNAFAVDIVKVQDEVKVSTLPKNAYVIMTGNTTLVVDESHTLKRLVGGHSLTIKGDKDKTLKVTSEGTHVFMDYARSEGQCIMCDNLTIDANVIAKCTSRNENGWSTYRDIEVKKECVLLGGKLESVGVGQDGNLTAHTLRIKGGELVGKTGEWGHNSVSCPYFYMEGGSLVAQNAKDADVAAMSVMEAYISGGDIKLKGGGFYSARKLQVDGGTFTVEGILGIRVKNMIMNGGKVDVNSSRPIFCDDILITRGGIIHAVSSSNSRSNQAIYAKSLFIDGGTIYAKGKEYGVEFVEDLRVSAGTSTFEGPQQAIYTTKGLMDVIDNFIIAPKNGRVSDDNTVVDENGYPATYVLMSVPPLSGSVNKSSLPAYPGTQLSYSLSGMVSQIAEGRLFFFWQESADGETGWTDIEGAESKFYTVKTSDVGKYLRVRILASGTMGVVYSSPWKAEKWKCTASVVQPELRVYSGQVRVTNPQAGQEYLIYSSKKTVSQLTEQEWAKSVTLNSSIQTELNLGGTANTVNYVYTRVKATEGTLAGTDVASASIYVGTATAVQAISLNIRKVFENASRPYYLEVERDDIGAYYLLSGSVYRVDVTPTPANVTFQGVRGSSWLIGGTARVTQYGGFYADRACTTLISSDEYYKTVFFKPQDGTAINYKELRVEFTRGYNDVVSDACLVNIGTSKEYYKLENVRMENVLVVVGEKVEGVKAILRPDKASMTSFTASLKEGEGTAPVISFDKENQSFSVDASTASIGTYIYNVLVNGSVSATLTVKVTAPVVQEVYMLPEAVTLERGESVKPELVILPANAVPESTIWIWLGTAEVDKADDGTITVRPDSPRGTYSAVAVVDHNLSASCLITVPGKDPELSFSEHVVHAQKDKTFTQPALLNPHSLPVTYYSEDETVATVDGKTGTVKILADGSTRIKASFAGDDEYEPDEDSYVLLVGDGLRGDVNEDGKVDISDIVAVINHIAGISSWPRADVNVDKTVDISDIVAIINIIAGS